MKIWQEYGSEHSANLVLIGHFRTVSEAERAVAGIGELAAVGPIAPSTSEGKFTDEMRDLMKKLDCYYLTPSDFESFPSDHHVERSGQTVHITTDEVDISAILKIFIHLSAKVEVYSRHDYPEQKNPGV